MVFDQIEKLKREYTDKYVVVDAGRPDLARFRGTTGRIKTINMSGRALVEFDANNNIGWYDIALDFLKVVDQPLPKPAESHEKAPKKEAPAPKAKPAAATTGEKKLSPLEMARAQGAAKPTGAAPKKSTADVLAAARGAKAEAAAPAAKPAPAGETKKPSTADILAAARANKAAPAEAKAAAPAAKPAAPAPKPAAAAAPKGKLSTADILAAARANKAAAAASAPAPAAKPSVEEPVAEEAPAAEAEPAPVATVQKPAAAKPAGGKLNTTADKVAWCREHDAK